MAGQSAAQKAAKQAERRRIRNKSVRSSVKTYVKKAEAAGALDSPAVLDAIRALDRAAKKGVIHPNNAARRKSRLIARLKRASA